MKKSLYIALVLGLTGCASAQMNVHNQYKSAAQKEQEAWARAQKNSDQICGFHDDSNPLPREKAVETANCWSKIAQTDVLPYVLFPELANEYILALKQISLDYQKGKIDRNQAKLNQEKAWNNYYAKQNQKYQESMQFAQQADIAAQQQRAQSSNAFVQILQQQEQMRQQQAQNAQAQMPTVPTHKTTTCRNSGSFGGSVVCDTW